MPLDLPARKFSAPLAAPLQKRGPMPNKNTMERARRDARQGKAPTTQAGEFVHEEIEHVRQGKHGAKNAKQAIAIGLSKARRAGVKLAPPRAGATSEPTRRKAEKDATAGKRARTTGRRAARKPAAASRRRSQAATGALKRSGSAAASPRALSRQAKDAAARRRSSSATRRPAKRRATTRRQSSEATH